MFSALIQINKNKGEKKARPVVTLDYNRYACSDRETSRCRVTTYCTLHAVYYPHFHSCVPPHAILLKITFTKTQLKSSSKDFSVGPEEDILEVVKTDGLIKADTYEQLVTTTDSDEEFLRVAYIYFKVSNMSRQIWLDNSKNVFSLDKNNYGKAIDRMLLKHFDHLDFWNKDVHVCYEGRGFPHLPKLSDMALLPENQLRGIFGFCEVRSVGYPEKPLQKAGSDTIRMILSEKLFCFQFSLYIKDE